MARAKKRASSKEQKQAMIPNKKQFNDLLQKEREEQQMLDDHGKVVLGRRDRKPLLPEETE